MGFRKITIVSGLLALTLAGCQTEQQQRAGTGAIIGGGVGSLAHLLPRVQKRTRELINGYIQSPAILENIESYIVNPGLGNRSGVLGAIALAEQSLQKS